jgi:uncharacterized protein (TIGR03067 family)
MNHHDDAFLQAIIDEPDNDTLRLVYADWLEMPCRLQGIWQLQRIKHEGKEYEEVRGWFIISGKQLTCVIGHIGDVSGPLKLDAAKEPATIDVDFDFGKYQESLHGIYAVKGDTLKICFGVDVGKERPKEFDAKTGSPYRLWVFKRVKDRGGPRR